MKKRNIAVGDLGARVKTILFPRARNIVLLIGRQRAITAGRGWLW